MDLIAYISTLVSGVQSFLLGLSEPVLFLLAVLVITVSIFIGSALTTYGTAWERMRAGYHNAFLKLPHSFIAFLFSASIVIGALTGGEAQSQGLTSDPNTLPVLLPGLLVLLLVIYISIRAMRGD